VLSSAVFLAEIFVKWIAKWQNSDVEWVAKATALLTENIARADTSQYSVTHLCDREIREFETSVLLISENIIYY
jgi:flagellar basal body rod protein FlgB